MDISKGHSVRYIKKLFVVSATIVGLSQLPSVAAGQCNAKSGDKRVSLIELYTSEGCSSCPPADKWLSRLSANGDLKSKVVPLSLHVDYWNYIGWQDPYSGPQYTQRQREIAHRNNLRTIYTPQVVLNGQDFRAWHRQNMSRTLGNLNNRPALADLKLEWNSEGSANSIKTAISADLASGAGTPSDHILFLAVYENDIKSRVNAGENDGRLLEHDNVVREMYALPFSKKRSINQSVALSLKPDWNRSKLGIAVFVQNRRNGEIMQALAQDLVCDS